jgi:hypothetical protein
MDRRFMNIFGDMDADVVGLLRLGLLLFLCTVDFGVLGGEFACWS